MFIVGGGDYIEYQNLQDYSKVSGKMVYTHLGNL